MSILLAHLKPARPVYNSSIRIAKALYRYQSTKSCDPLRILFCGSEEFSIASLSVLHKEHLVHPESIASIDVACRPPKLTVPIKSAAEKWGLRVHEIDTFRGWTPPMPENESINLIVAVSFGLFIPPRILNGAKYGGLNVHPSLLPDFRGPAPLHYTIIFGDSRTGVTLQTLHPTKFDHGVVLDQTPHPGIDIPNADSCTVSDLNGLLAPIGANMLLQGIRDRLFVPPVEDVGWYAKAHQGRQWRHAPKITPEDRHIRWHSWSGKEIIRRYRALGPLWNKTRLSRCQDMAEKRAIFSGLVLQHHRNETPIREVGLPFTEIDTAKSISGKPAFLGNLTVKAANGDLVEIRGLKVEGSTEDDAPESAAKAGLFNPEPVIIQTGGQRREFWVFRNELF